MSRQRATAPEGRLTLPQAAVRLGVTVSRAHQLMRSGVLTGQRDAISGVWSVPAADVDARRIHRGETLKALAATGKRVPLYLGVGASRHRIWAAAADAAGLPLGLWLAGLADAASGVT